MSVKFGKRVLSFAAAAVVLCLATTAYAQEAVGSGAAAESLTIESCAENIKNIYKSRYPEHADFIEETVDTLSQSEVFAGIFEDDGASAFQIIEETLWDVLNPTPSLHMQTDDLYISKYSFPNVQQINKQYCGPASTVMALIGGGASSYYYTWNETITNGWQRELGESNELLATKTPENCKEENKWGTEISNITKVLKDNVPSVNGYTYKTKAFTINSYMKALDYVSTSLVLDAVPVIRVSDTSLLEYYGGKFGRF